ncbi:MULTISPECIES: RdgB/HAM1 family non-canonical purine NTP pyrophosphatase [Parachlamydia]|jgi:XTP/dITP diphosphohydrolase|uniref:dITP/XTP pyrophosphatase n=2 Tax=Parachlamydia acanthamoebae TaxID=83552 RepID=F8KWC9_PARAV|nr:RdgB/HAM1 family non-canonical purine NTP pyrophosphatase [Parachlamydia acanthamoebae]CCB85327.1 nucleoside-triphosphatase [Parachlamydia acanthamoebae UV-7]
MEIVLASSNLHKIREFREMFKSLPRIDVLSLLNFPQYKSPVEEGKTFQENAQLKAVDAAKVLGKWVLADDSGLVVPALDGAPGIYSRRYAGEDATDAENRQKLLQNMQHLSEIQRSAYFQCSLVLALPTGEVKKSVTGICEGFLLKEEKGRYGFGYDSLFVKHDYDKTFAELDDSTKNRISHRYKAFEKLLGVLQSL